jgi:hypothetical protein
MRCPRKIGGGAAMRSGNQDVLAALLPQRELNN